MIRINLLGGEKKKATRAVAAFGAGQRLTALCSLIVVAALVGIGWWYWSLSREAAQVDSEIAAAQQEAARLRSMMAEVEAFEAQRARIQERVALIEELRAGQSIPVQLLDHVSRSLPDMLWLTSMTQTDTQVTLVGSSRTLVALSDFVGNLGGGTVLRRPIEIVDSQVQEGKGSGAAATPDLIQFTVRAQLNKPEPKPEEPPAGRGRGARAARGRQGAAR
jgi:type IV pilus assembly protein PilN